METFRQNKIVGVMRIIYDYAKVPSYPDTGPRPTVRELFPSDPEDTLNPRYMNLYRTDSTALRSSFARSRVLVKNCSSLLRQSRALPPHPT